MKNILIGLAGTAVDPDVVRMVASFAKAEKARVVGVHVIEVRWNLALDAVLEKELEAGEHLLSAAETIARDEGITLETEILQAREAAAALVDEARSRACDLIVVGMPYRRRLGKVYVGRTVNGVFERAPCAVLAYRQEAPA